MNKEKNEIYYIVMIISKYAQQKGLSIKDAFFYLEKFGGMEFLTQNYEAEHLLSENDVMQDLDAICKRNGGEK